MFHKLFFTKDDVSLTIIRVGLGLVIFPHGMQKLLGWFGGGGFSGTMSFFTDNLHIPVVFAVLAILAEALGSLGLITGFLTRIAAFAISVNMVVAVYLLHWQHGFFMNWMGNLSGEGYEFHILAVVMGIVLMIAGGGKWSVDRVLAKR